MIILKKLKEKQKNCELRILPLEQLSSKTEEEEKKKKNRQNLRESITPELL